VNRLVLLVPADAEALVAPATQYLEDLTPPRSPAPDDVDLDPIARAGRALATCRLRSHGPMQAPRCARVIRSGLLPSGGGLRIRSRASACSGARTTTCRRRGDAKTGDSFVLDLRPGERAMDVFEHPYAYAAWHRVPTRPAPLALAA
jgi:hypothetical protein